MSTDAPGRCPRGTADCPVHDAHAERDRGLPPHDEPPVSGLLPMWTLDVWDPATNGPYPPGLAQALAVIEEDFVQPQRQWMLRRLVATRCRQLLGRSWWSAFGLVSGSVPLDDVERARLRSALELVARQHRKLRGQEEPEARALVARQAVGLCLEEERQPDPKDRMTSRGLAWALLLEERLQVETPPDLAELDRWWRVLRASLKVQEILKEARDAAPTG